jgi:serine phosphatase RsbU (regulator of sigma subunit)
MVADVVCGEQAVYIGAREDCLVCLDDPQVPPQQLVIYPEGPSVWVVQQLSPEQEVLVNQTRLIEKETLKTGDEIQVRDFVIRVYPEHEDQPGARSGVGTSRAQLERFAAARLPPGTLIKKADEPVGLQHGDLARIGELTLGLAGCTQVEQLMDVALRTMLVTFAAQRAWMGVRRVNYGSMEYVEGRLLTGPSTDLPETGNVLKPRVLDRGQFVLVPIFSAEERASVLAGPLPGPDGTLGMVYIDTGNTNRRFSTPELDVFVVLCSLFGVQLDAIFKQIARNRSAMVEGEVAVAHAIQARLTPRKLPQWDKLQWGAFREPGRVNTGDIYDVVKLGNNMAAFMVAHTPATGPLPSMLMGQMQAAFRFGAMHQDPPHVLLRSLNRIMYDGETDHALNAIVGVIDPNTGEMRYAMAGSTGSYIISNRGEERPLAPEKPIPALGVSRNAVFPLLPEQLDPGETLVAFTPGVTTAKNCEEETFGEERFVNILCDGFGQLASAMLKEMLTDLRNFTEAGSQPDDITVLMAHHVNVG